MGTQPGEDIKRLWEYFNHALGLALLRYGIVLSCFIFILNFVLFSCCRVKGGGGVAWRDLPADWLLSWNNNSCCSQIVASSVFNCYRQNSEHFCDLYNLWFILKLKLCCMFIHFNNFRITRFPPLPWILRRAKVTRLPHVRASSAAPATTTQQCREVLDQVCVIVQ